MTDDKAPADKGGDPTNIEQRGLIIDTALALITGGAAGAANAIVSDKLSQAGQGDTGDGEGSSSPSED